MTKIIVYTDGACSGNPGPGGWGVVIKSRDNTLELNGGMKDTTNNQMELQAAIEGLRYFKEPMELTIVTDSKYVLDGITKWIKSWKMRSWRLSNGDPVKNKQLWVELDKLCSYHQVSWIWVKGHSSHPENDRADALAREAIFDIK